MKVLHLQNGKIQSYESLSFMDAPLLEKAFISGNDMVTNCKAFNRMVLPSIEIWSMDDERVKDCSLQRTKIHKQPKSLALEMSEDCTVINENLTDLVKL